jgi:hypothetical protein
LPNTTTRGRDVAFDANHVGNLGVPMWRSAGRQILDISKRPKIQQLIVARRLLNKTGAALK